MGNRSNEAVGPHTPGTPISGYLKTSASMPPQVKKAFADGKEVWRLEGIGCSNVAFPLYRYNGTGYTLYALFNGNGLEWVVQETRNESDTYPLSLDDSEVESVPSVPSGKLKFYYCPWVQQNADQPLTLTVPGKYSQMVTTTVWRGKKDGERIELECVETTRCESKNETSDSRSVLHIAATSKGWQSKLTYNKDIEYVINTESDARALYGHEGEGLHYSPDRRKATQHITQTEDSRGSVRNPDADEMRALKLPD